MASGHRKRKAAALRIEVLDPAGLTNVAEADRGVVFDQNNLMNISFYSRDGVSPTFTAASTTALSDAVSNTDGTWTKAGLTGEVTNVGAFTGTSMSGAVGLSATAKHYYFPAVGGTQTNLSGANGVASPVIIYSGEGPQASYVPYYLGGTAATASIKFGSQITGAGSPTHVVVYIGGELEASDRIRLIKASDNSLFSATAKFMTGSNITTGSNSGTTVVSGSELSSNLYRKAFFLTTASIGTAAGLIVEFSSSAKTSTTPVAGVFVVISSGSYA